MSNIEDIDCRTQLLDSQIVCQLDVNGISGLLFCAGRADLAVPTPRQAASSVIIIALRLGLFGCSYPPQQSHDKLLVLTKFYFGNETE